MTLTRCPSREDLERLLDERLEPADLRRVSQHVAACAACQAALDGLTDGAGPDQPSWRGRAADSTTPRPDFLDRIKRAPPASGPAAAPSDPNTVLVAERPDEAEPLPALEEYEVLGVLGRGAEGVVYKARHRPLGRLVALKMLRDADRAGPEPLRRFRLEAQTLARLRHPNIVQVYEVGSRDGRPFFALEYVEGGPLSARLKGEPQPARDAAALVEALARAVHAAHEAGVVHRDLKPANVLLAEGPAGEAYGVPKIGDFGLAKRVQVDSSLTHTGMVLGTPSYMAPEQARAEGKEVGPACDIYALGSILYHLLTGRPPFVGARPMEVLLQVVHEEPVSVRRLFPQAPRDLETICLKCLQKEPRRRYATAAALADDLRRYLDGRPVQARPTPPWERAWKAARRRPVIAALAAATTLAVLLLLGGGAYYNRLLAAAVKRSDEKAHDASVAEKKADDEAAAARAAEQTARANAAEAERQRGLALDAYEKLVFEVQDKLGFEAATQSMRQSLLKTAADGLKEMAKGANATASDRVRAAAYMKIGRILYTISDDDGARAQFEACRDVTTDLQKANPHDAQARDLLCDAYSGLGNLAGRAGRSGEAAGYFQQERDCAKAWLDDEPDNPAARERLAESYNWLAGDAPDPLNPKAFEEYNDRLLALAEPWNKADAKNPSARYYLAAAQYREGFILRQKGDPIEARNRFLESKAALDGLAAEAPSERKYSQSLLTVWQALAALYIELGEPGAALPYATAAAESYRRGLQPGKNDPANAEFQWLCGDAFVTRAIVLMRLMRHEEAVKELTAATELFRALQPRLKPGALAAKVSGRQAELQDQIDFCKAVPLALKDPDWVLRQPAAPRQDLLVIRVCLLMQQGRTEEAEKAADLLDGQKPDNTEDCYSLAYFLVGERAGLTAGKEPAAFTDAERAMRRRFLDRALAALNRAADLGFKDVERLNADDELWVLRQEPGFRALVERLNKSP